MAPRLRDDLVAATVEEDGVIYVDLTDPATGVNFRFYDFEYELARQLTGQPVDDVVAWASVTYELELTVAALDEFVEKLAGLGFLADGGAGAQPTEISPLSPSSVSAPFSAPIAIPDEPEIVELAAAPMFGEGSARLVVPAAESPAGAGTEPTTVAPAVPSFVASPAGTSPPRLAGEGDLPDLRPRDATAPPGRSRTLPGINLVPLTPMTSPSEGHGAPPVLPRLQSLGSPLPPLAADVVIGGGEIKRAPPRPVLEASPAAVGPPIAPFPLAATPPPLFGKAPPASPGPTPARPGGPSPGGQPPSRGSTPAPASSPRSPSPPVEETPFTSIAHAIVSELERTSESPAPVGWGGALEPPSGLVVAPSRPAGTTATGPTAQGPAAPVSAAPASTAPVAAAPVTAAPMTAAPVTAAPIARAPVSRAPIAGAPIAVPPVTAAPPIQVTPSAPGDASVPASKPESAKALVPVSDSPSAATGWTSTLANEVEKPVTDRGHPPGPAVVVMPPVEPAAVPPAPKRRAPLVVGVLMLSAVAAAAVYALRDQPHSPAPAPAAPSVHVTVPQPTTVYEWFATTGMVIAGHDDELAFKVAGRLQDVMPPGTTFSSGEAVGHLQGAAVRELNVNRIRSRVAFFEQLRDSSRAAGNEAAARQAEANLAARKRELAAAQTRLADLEIRPAVAGTIGQVLVDRGAFVKAGAPVFRIRAAGPRATFALGAVDQMKARALGFCRLETLPGGVNAPPPPAPGDAAVSATAADKVMRSLDCALPPAALPGGAADAGGALAVDLAAASGVAPGTAVRLASARFDGVFPLPRSAIVHDAAGKPPADRVWIVSAATQAADSRVVELAPSSSPDPALVSHGLATGDAIVVDPPADLVGGAPVNVVH